MKTSPKPKKRKKCDEGIRKGIRRIQKERMLKPYYCHCPNGKLVPFIDGSPFSSPLLPPLSSSPTDSAAIMKIKSVVHFLPLPPTPYYYYYYYYYYYCHYYY